MYWKDTILLKRKQPTEKISMYLKQCTEKKPID